MILGVISSQNIKVIQKAVMPSITFSGSVVGQRTVNYKNEDTVSGTLFYRRVGDVWENYDINAGSTLSIIYNGTPLARFDVECYFSTLGKAQSDTAASYGFYYGDLT